ncbi:threonine-phosphate decarboxylase CobD [Paenibacillus nasutitermitis]|uniref:threonine-phosphate decarboxylase n=1 Tax=Paenibacillus nasutitermitis TaxID=1652958 RepID=A0A917DSQ5_9BACL|nr:threonine-phosphate decarboxylase CobD [Paenibacillus nasutitermitis]GGD67535.1 threonine-phosphate decarboxylase [Paenibacillus nasutitermitis]
MMLERFGHGGDLLTAQELFGIGAGKFIDFSANMNPQGPPACVSRILRDYAGTIGQYPDPASRSLIKKLAAHHGVSELSILAGNGAAELIDLTVRTLQPKVTVVAAPSFVEYRDAALKCGSAVRELALAPEAGFRLTMQGAQTLLATLRGEGLEAGDTLWFLGSPNNPTGQLVDPAIIRKLLIEGEQVVVDEAFMDFVPDAAAISLLEEAAAHDRLFVIRSLTKFYAIPGIRLGYMTASPESIGRIRALQVPWSVNSLAQQIGQAVLADEEYRKDSMNWIAEERPWLENQLQALGLDVYPGAANYVLFALPRGHQLNAKLLQQQLGHRGILIRDASLFNGLDDRFCRIAVRLRKDHLALLKEMKALLERKENLI